MKFISTATTHEVYQFMGDVVGIAGVVLMLLAYLLLQLQKLNPYSIAYSLLNLLGALGILFSLLFNWNLSAAVIEGAWAAVSLLGLVKAVRSNKTE